MKTKVCIQCTKRKPIAAFGVVKVDGRKEWTNKRCRACRNANAKADYQANKERYFRHARERDGRLDDLINSYKDRPCADCGVSYPPYVMDLDHRDPKEKVMKVSTMRRRRMNFELIISEMEKCDVICSNCHRERTNERNPARYTRLVHRQRGGLLVPRGNDSQPAAPLWSHKAMHCRSQGLGVQQSRPERDGAPEKARPRGGTTNPRISSRCSKRQGGKMSLKSTVITSIVTVKTLEIFRHRIMDSDTDFAQEVQKKVFASIPHERLLRYERFVADEISRRGRPA